jgi:hypothetical protein
VIDIATGNQHDLEMLDAEGLGEQVHFLYDSTLNVIAVQKNCISAPLHCRIFGHLGGHPLDFQLIVTEGIKQVFRKSALSLQGLAIYAVSADLH